jgi:hypothetical protein
MTEPLEDGKTVMIGDVVYLESEAYVVDEIWNDRSILLRPKKCVFSTKGMSLVSRKEK